ncbi:MAG: hypothetical protein AAF533_19980 [Acidobacteriota bacterium]
MARGYHFYLEMVDNLEAGRGIMRTLPYGHGDRHAIRTPLYPLCLATGRTLGLPDGWSIVLLGLLAGTTSVLLVGALAQQWWGRPAGRVAGWGAALWPHSVLHDTVLQDTALYTALFLGFLLLVVRLRAARVATPASGLGRQAALAGLLGGLAVLTRVALLPTVVVLTAWMVLPWPGPRRSGWWRPLVVTFAVLGLTLSPWLVRNHLRLGKPVLTSDTGRSLWLGNNPHTLSVYPNQSIDRAEERAWSAVPEVEQDVLEARAEEELLADDWFRQRALAHLRAEPAAAVKRGLVKAWATFSPWRSPRGSTFVQVAHLVGYGGLLLLALATAWRWRARWLEVLLPVGLAMGLLALQSAVFFGHSGYRAYLDLVLLAVAAGLLVRPEASTGLETAEAHEVVA